MTKAGIRLIFRSKEPEEVSIGDYRYKYTVSPLLLAKITSKSFFEEDQGSINQNTKSKLKFDTLLPNDASDRVNRISHILYMGTFYKVDSIRPYPPRVALTIENIEMSDIKSELSELVQNASKKSQNDLKVDAFDHLKVALTEPEEKEKGGLLLKDDIIQIWDGEKYQDLLLFIKDKV